MTEKAKWTIRAEEGGTGISQSSLISRSQMISTWATGTPGWEEMGLPPGTKRSTDRGTRGWSEGIWLHSGQLK